MADAQGNKSLYGRTDRERLVAELMSWLGFPASVAAAFGIVWGAFATLEKVTSSEKKAVLTQLLRSTDWSAAPLKLTEAFKEVFEAVFGKHQLSAKCLRRSFLFSILAIILLLAFGFLNHYEYFQTMPFVIFYKPAYRIIFFGWLFWSIIIDFINLYKTRLLIRLVDALRAPALLFFVLVVADLLVSVTIFVATYSYLLTLNIAHQYCNEISSCPLAHELRLSLSIYRGLDTAMAICQKQHYSCSLQVVEANRSTTSAERFASLARNDEDYCGCRTTPPAFMPPSITSSLPVT
ncbi:hypothetical protein [Bradyrhizobium sp. USDA 4452]